MKNYERYLSNIVQQSTNSKNEPVTEGIQDKINEEQVIVKEDIKPKKKALLPLIEVEEKKEGFRKSFYIRKTEKKMLERQAKERNMDVSPYIRKLICVSDKIDEVDRTVLLDAKANDKSESDLVCVYMYKEEAEILKESAKKFRVSESGLIRILIYMNE